MEKPNFKGSELKHIKGQEGRVDNVEKAQAMAESEDAYRSIAPIYREFLDTGEFTKSSYRWSTPEIQALFAQLKEGEITPEDLNEIADRMGEVQGAIEDYRKDARYRGPTSLDMERFVFGAQMIKNGLQMSNYSGDPSQTKSGTAARDAFHRYLIADMKHKIATSEIEESYRNRLGRKQTE